MYYYTLKKITLTERIKRRLSRRYRRYQEIRQLRIIRNFVKRDRDAPFYFM